MLRSGTLWMIQSTTRMECLLTDLYEDHESPVENAARIRTSISGIDSRRRHIGVTRQMELELCRFAKHT
jgi:hypothetical protein